MIAARYSRLLETFLAKSVADFRAERAILLNEI